MVASAADEVYLMPRRALGRLLELREKVAGITGFDSMDLSRKTIVVMAADHGLTEEVVSAYPPEVTEQVVCGFAAVATGAAAADIVGRGTGIDDERLGRKA